MRRSSTGPWSAGLRCAAWVADGHPRRTALLLQAVAIGAGVIPYFVRCAHPDRPSSVQPPAAPRGPASVIACALAACAGRRSDGPSSRCCPTAAATSPARSWWSAAGSWTRRRSRPPSTGRSTCSRSWASSATPTGRRPRGVPRAPRRRSMAICTAGLRQTWEIEAGRGGGPGHAAPCRARLRGGPVAPVGVRTLPLLRRGARGLIDAADLRRATSSRPAGANSGMSD